jgi:hypothetical protein
MNEQGLQIIFRISVQANQARKMQTTQMSKCGARQNPLERAVKALTWISPIKMGPEVEP